MYNLCKRILWFRIRFVTKYRDKKSLFFPKKFCFFLKIPVQSRKKIEFTRYEMKLRLLT